MRIKTCTICGIEYEPKSGRFATSKYCSLTCAGKGKFRQQEKKCRNCGKAFMFKPSQLNKYANGGRYCSRKCAYEYRVKINSTKPIKDKYGRTNRRADVEWRDSVKRKYNYTCQKCGAYNKIIDAHHVNTRSQRPDLRTDVKNGITLCRPCHSWVHHHPKDAAELGLMVSLKYDKILD